MTRFLDCSAPATADELNALENRVGVPLPLALKRLFRDANGGRPTPSIFRDERGSIDVSECLAVRAGRGSVLWTYELLIESKAAAPRHYVPFAVDSGGNCFLVDCVSEDAQVHLLLHDPAFRLCRLGVGLEEFLQRLTDLD